MSDTALNHFLLLLEPPTCVTLLYALVVHNFTRGNWGLRTIFS